MKEKIIEKACELFLNLGFKSVTMDDLANEMGISKKTIYQYFENKSTLVEATTQQVFESVCTGIDCIRHTHENPIKELFEINNFVKEFLKDEKASPQYQLQKYYPKTFKTLKNNQFNMMVGCVTENLNTGINLGLYRPEIKPAIIARIYFLGASGIRDQELFPSQEFNFSVLLNEFLEYHLRGIVTKKGEKELTQHINQIHNS